MFLIITSNYISKKEAEKLKSREMKHEGWMLKDEGWKMKDEGGFEDKQTDERTNRHLWL